MTYFKNPKNLEDLKKQYRDLSMQYHPDRPGGSNQVMSAVNNEYETLFNLLKNKANASENKKDHVNEVPEDFISIINRIINLEGLVIEIVGNWIWLSGSTYPHKEILKELNFRWSKARKKWYLGELKGGGRYYKKKSWEELKSTFGYSKIDVNPVLQLA